jgi:hypothetical protein
MWPDIGEWTVRVNRTPRLAVRRLLNGIDREQAPQAVLPFSESPANPTGIGPTQDDISLIWLSDSTQPTNAVKMLEAQSPASANIAGMGEIFSGLGIGQMFNLPGLPPAGTPDIIVTPNIGVTYSGSGKKLAEHGGFSHDDTNVMMVLSHPRITRELAYHSEPSSLAVTPHGFANSARPIAPADRRCRCAEHRRISSAARRRRGPTRCRAGSRVAF